MVYMTEPEEDNIVIVRLLENGVGVGWDSGTKPTTSHTL